jgi:hypothetical protein
MKFLLNISFLLIANLVIAQSNSEQNNKNVTPANNNVIEEVEESEKALKRKKESSSNERAASRTLDALSVQEDQSSFEFNYSAYVNAPIKNATSFQFLQKAYAIYPENVDLYDDFMAYYEMSDNQMDRKKFSTKLYKSNTISDYLIEYNHNVLVSLPSNAILFTNGYDDTYPVWVNQDVKNVRKDITIININLLKDKEYREKILNRAKLTYDKKNQGIELIEDLMISNPTKEIYLGLTVDKELLGRLYKDLYLVGLVLKYSNSPFNNVALIQSNWENQFKKKTIEQAPSSFKQKQVLANYLLPLIYLHNYYIDTNELLKAKELKELVLKIASYNGKQKIVAAKLKE